MPTARTTTAIFKEALEYLSSIDPIELCNEAKIERCRATRDLSSCGRYVQHVLNSCGHASLCAECIQRCDVCPICRTSIPNSGSRLRLRLYYKCMEAGLISKKCDERFQDKYDCGGHVMADIQRLYSLFDVALENNLVSLICHYVTDVCMDENAVSSDPVLAFLLDEVVVKDWCKQTFNNIISELQEKYSLGVEEMKTNLSSLQKLVFQLTGVSNVLEVMVSSFRETFSGPLHDLHHLLETTLKAKQHLEIMVWCIRHEFLDNIQSRYPNYTSWNFQFLQRKSAAVARSWPNTSNYIKDSSGFKPTLFIEEALSNLGIEQIDADKREEFDILCLHEGNSPFLQSNIDASEEVTFYPFETVRAAIDILFLHGTSDMVIAKRAIFLYYLFDRHWTKPDAEWRHLVDDFASSFDISRHLVLESLTFYLLDDHSDQAVQEATHLLSEIADPETHPKIAQVLLERHRPDVALTVLRCSGRDGFSVYPKSEHDSFLCVSLDEAITAIRVKIECGLLTESFMYQRMHCSKVKELASKKNSMDFSSNSKLDSWIYQVEVLVTEICELCIRRNLVDRMIELPWNSDEEKFLHKCLFGHACQNPGSICGSLLVVFYLQAVWGKSGKAILGIHNSKPESLKGNGALCVASEGQLPQTELNLEALEPEKLNHIAEDCTTSNSSFLPSERTAGKPGFISFHGLPYQRRDESFETSPSKEIPKVFWFIGPTVLVSFLVFPSLYLRRLFSAVFEDSLLTDFLILFFTEALFYGGVAIFLLLVDHIWRPVQQNGSSKNDSSNFQFGLRISSVATLVLSLIIPLVTMGMVWPWTGPAASATLAPYLVGLIVQFAFERYARYQESPSWPVIPIIFQVYRLHQLNRAAQLVTALSFSVRGAETTSQTLAINSSLGTLLTVLQILGIVCIWSLSSFLMRFTPSSQSISES